VVTGGPSLGRRWARALQSLSFMDRDEHLIDKQEPTDRGRSAAATPAEVQANGSPASPRQNRARPGESAGPKKAQAAQAAPFPNASRVSPASPRSKFTLSEIDLIQWYARTRFQSAPRERCEFETVHPEAVRISRLLDAADIALKIAEELVRHRQNLRREARRAARRRGSRRSGGLR